jgi:phage terminase small subunit
MKGAKPAVVAVDGDAVPAVPQPPAWLGRAAKAEWRRVVPVLVERRILTNADLGSLENYCISQGTVRLAARQMARSGEPELLLRFHRMQMQAMQTSRQLAAELGLTPVSRSRPTIRTDDDDDVDLSPLDL